MDSFLENAGGYTPVPDVLVRKYGFETAYVWGRIHRYCQMANGVCTASHQTIADRAGMSRRTLIEKLNALIDAGYIEDKTPDLKNKPHTYCTKIGEAKITSTMQISHTESTTPAQDEEAIPPPDSELGMRNLHSDDADNAQSDSPTMQNLHTTYAEIAQPTMQNLHLKKDSLETPQETTKESKDSSPNGEGDKSPPPIQKLERAEPEVENIAKHPAIQAYRSVANRYPDKATWDMIATAVGRDPPDIAFWTNVVRDYIACGWNKINVKTMLEHYKRRELPTQKASIKNGYHGTSQNNTGYDPALESGGLTGTAREIAEAFDRKRRRGRDGP